MTKIGTMLKTREKREGGGGGGRRKNEQIEDRNPSKQRRDGDPLKMVYTQS